MSASDHRVAQLRPTMRIPLGALEEHDLAPLGIADLYHRSEGHPLFVHLAVAPDEDGKRAALRVRSRTAAGPRATRPSGCSAPPACSRSRSRPRGSRAFSSCTTAEVAEELDRLCHRRLLSLDDGRFRFRTRLMREAMADSLSPASRSLLEQRIARDGAPGPERTAWNPLTRGCRPTAEPAARTPRRARVREAALAS